MSRARQILMHQAASHRRQPLLKSHSAAPAGSRLGEVVGGTAAECAAVCCCCPCGLMHLLVLAFYKVPVALCRRALRTKRRAKLMKKGLLPQRLRRRCTCGCDDSEIPIHHLCVQNFSDISQKSEEVEKEAMELEKEMWDMFYGTGFWRSPSNREASPNLTYNNPAKSHFQVVSL